MGIGSFFRKILGIPDKQPAMQPAPDAVKEASDYLMPQPEIAPEKMEAVHDESRFADDAHEEFERRIPQNRDSGQRVEESGD